MMEKFQTLEIRGRKSSNHWKFFAVLFPMLGSLAMAQGPGSISQGGFFQAWWGASALNPKSLPNLVLWLDMADSSKINLTNTTQVLSVLDKSEFGRHATNRAASSTIVYTNQLNGKKVITVNNSILVGVWNNTFTQQTTIVVVQPNNLSTQQRIFSQRISGFNDFDGTGHYVPLVGSTVSSNIASITGGIAGRSPVVATNNQWTVLKSVHSGTNIVNYNYSAAGASFAHTLNTTFFTYHVAAYAAGNDNYNGFGINGNYAEVIVYNRRLTQIELDIIDLYLKAKWGL